MTVPTIPDLPTPPQPADDKPTFNSRMFAWIIAILDWTTAVNAVSAAMNALYTTIAGLASAAAASAAASESSRLVSAANAQAAAESAGAIAWVSGTTYAGGDQRWSPITGRVYRRISAGAGTTDPSADAANWVDVAGGRRVRLTSGATLQVRTRYELDSTAGPFTVTLPASFNDQDWIDFVDVGYSLAINPVTIARNGNNIRRTAEDLKADLNGDAFRLTGRTSLGWIEE